MKTILVFASLIIAQCSATVTLDEEPRSLDKYCADKKDGWSFKIGCAGKCSCSNIRGTPRGVCTSLCPPFLSADKNCFSATPNLKCCKKSHCPRVDLKNANCVQDFQNVPKEISNWNVRFNNFCVGTIINERTVYAPQGCYKEGDVISSPAKLSNKKLKAGVVQGVGQSIRLIRDSFLFLTTFHNINLPPKAMCEQHCSLFVAASNVNGDRKFLIPAEKDKDCPTTADGQSCLVLKNELSGETCVNLGGATVAVMEGDAFFLVGFLPPTDPAGLSENRCDKDLSSKRKYFDICSKVAF